MRVTSEMMHANSMSRLSTRLAAYERTHIQMATGRRFQVASEDVGASVRAHSVRAGMKAREQELRNITDAISWLDIADSQLQGAVSILQRVRELAVRGSTSLSVEESQALASEVYELRDSLVTVANFSYRGRPLFAGTSGGPAVTFGAGWSYTGNDGQIQRRVAEQDVVAVNVTAEAAFGFARGAGQDLFSRLDALGAALEAGDGAAVKSLLPALDTGLDDLTAALSTIGARTNRIESSATRTEDTLAALRSELSELEDIDLAEATMNLRIQEVAYQATLQAVAKALPPSLASFLR